MEKGGKDQGYRIMWPAGSDQAGEMKFSFSCLNYLPHSTCKSMTNSGTQKKRKQPPAAEDDSEVAVGTPLETEKVNKAKKLSEWISVPYLDSLHPRFVSDRGCEQKKAVQLLSPGVQALETKNLSPKKR